MNFYAFHIGDYASATRHLSWEEDLAYRRLIDTYYMREGPLPADRKQVYRLVVASSKAQREAVDSVLNEFFVLSPDGYVNERCDVELQCYRKKSEKARQSAEARWSKQSAVQSQTASSANASADAMRTHSEGNAPNPNPSIDDEKIARASNHELFEKVDASLRHIPELDGHPVAANAVIAPIFQLVSKGFDLETQVVPSIRRQLCAARKPIKNWAYFVDGIAQDAAETVVPTALPKVQNGASHGSYRQPAARDTFAILEQSIAEQRSRAAGDGSEGSESDHHALPRIRQGAA